MYKIITNSTSNKEKNSVMECKFCGGTDVSEDPECGINICVDCGSSNSSIYTNQESSYLLHGSVVERQHRSGTVISSLCPSAGSHLVYGSGASKHNVYGKINYSDRKILSLKSINESIVGNQFNAAILDDTIHLTKIARKQNPSMKEMDISFLAASAYYVCQLKMPKTIEDIKKIYSITNEPSFTKAMTIIQGILHRKDFIITLKEQTIDEQDIHTSIIFAQKLSMPETTFPIIQTILKKFAKKNILADIITKNKIAVVIYYVIKELELPITQETLITTIELKSADTLQKYYKYLRANLHDDLHRIIVGSL
jgi:transcription initiation factor TFIIIB Brf1 subunit/transcription initiation factor TFIIB